MWEIQSFAHTKRLCGSALPDLQSPTDFAAIAKEEKQSLDFFFLLGTSDRSQERRLPLLFGTWVGSLGGVSPPAPEEISSSIQRGLAAPFAVWKKERRKGGRLVPWAGALDLGKGRRGHTRMHVTCHGVKSYFFRGKIAYLYESIGGQACIQ